MSQNRHDRDSGKTKEQKALLDELDSLKALLNKEKEEDAEESIVPAPWEFTPSNEAVKTASQKTPNVPSLKEAVEMPPPHRNKGGIPGKVHNGIPPLLDEVVIEGGANQAAVPSLTDVITPNDKSVALPPRGEELKNLVELLVERRLKQLKPAITSQIIRELERLYPSLKKR